MRQQQTAEPMALYGNAEILQNLADDNTIDAPEWDDVAKLSMVIGLEQLKRGMVYSHGEVVESIREKQGWT